MAQIGPSIVLAWNGTNYQLVFAGGAPLVMQGLAAGEGGFQSRVSITNPHQTVHVTEKFVGRALQPSGGTGSFKDTVTHVGNSVLPIAGQEGATVTGLLASQAFEGLGGFQARVIPVGHTQQAGAGQFGGSVAATSLSQFIHLTGGFRGSYTRSLPNVVGGGMSCGVVLFAYCAGSEYISVGVSEKGGQSSSDYEEVAGVFVWKVPP